MKRTQIFIVAMLLSVILAPASFNHVIAQKVQHAVLDNKGDKIIVDTKRPPCGSSDGTQVIVNNGGGNTTDQDDAWKKPVNSLRSGFAAYRKKNDAKNDDQDKKIDSLGRELTLLKRYAVETDSFVDYVGTKLEQSNKQLNQRCDNLSTRVDSLESKIGKIDASFVALEIRMGTAERLWKFDHNYLWFLDKHAHLYKKVRPSKSWQQHPVQSPDELLNKCANPYSTTSTLNFNQFNIPPDTDNSSKKKYLGWKIGCIVFGGAVLTDIIYMVVNKTNDPTAIMKGGPSGNGGHP